MNELINYLLQVSAILIILYLPYLFLFSKTNWFAINRSYLIISLIIAWLIPIINIPFSETAEYLSVLPEQINAVTSTSTTALTLPSTNPIPDQSVLPFNWLMLYFVGVFIMMFRNAWVILRIKKLRKQNQTVRIGQLKLVVGDKLPAFSIFNTIFLSTEEFAKHSCSLIFKHEKIHVAQGHTLDLLFAEMNHTILWFNPILLAYKKAIKEIHEYMADREVLRGGADFQTYVMTLHSEAIHAFSNNLSNYFKVNSVKKRIIMSSQKTNRKTLLGYTLIVPILIGCMILWSFIDDPITKDSKESKSKNLVILIDPGHGGKDPGAINTALGISEKDVNLAIALEIKKISSPGLEFILTRETDEFIDLNTRARLTQSLKADFLISLHQDAIGNPATKGSTLNYCSRNLFPESSKELSHQFGMMLKAKANPQTGGSSFDQPFLVLEKSSCPAILISLGYITNGSGNVN
jgi:N-acetylmuramoyl-L-alanine amidase